MFQIRLKEFDNRLFVFGLIAFDCKMVCLGGTTQRTFPADEVHFNENSLDWNVGLRGQTMTVASYTVLRRLCTVGQI